jgi:hypothetical protein
MNMRWLKGEGRPRSCRESYDVVTKCWWRREVNNSGSFEMTLTHAELLGK